jgi:hypothetical protein
MVRAGTLSIDANLKISQLDGKPLAVQGSADPEGDATRFLQGKKFKTGDQAQITGDDGQLGNLNVIFMTDAESV